MFGVRKVKNSSVIILYCLDTLFAVIPPLYFVHFCHVYSVLERLKICSQLGFGFHDSTFLKPKSG